MAADSDSQQLMMTACESLLPFQLMHPPAQCSSRFRAPFESGSSICTLRQAHLCQSGCCCCCRCLLIWEANDDGWAVPHLKLMTTLRGEEGRAPPTSSLVCIVCIVCSVYSVVELFHTSCNYSLAAFRSSLAIWCIILALGMLHRDKR